MVEHSFLQPILQQSKRERRQLCLDTDRLGTAQTVTNISNKPLTSKLLLENSCKHHV